MVARPRQFALAGLSIVKVTTLPWRVDWVSRRTSGASVMGVGSLAGRRYYIDSMP
ncbi:MAG: hypothetical protein WDO24_22980 [Pseudomonadota bacterium]